MSVGILLGDRRYTQDVFMILHRGGQLGQYFFHCFRLSAGQLQDGVAG